MEAYKELFRQKRNKEKREDAITYFQAIWTTKNDFGRLHEDTIRWNFNPNLIFLPKELGAWLVPPIRITVAGSKSPIQGSTQPQQTNSSIISRDCKELAALSGGTNGASIRPRQTNAKRHNINSRQVDDIEQKRGAWLKLTY